MFLPSWFLHAVLKFLLLYGAESFRLKSRRTKYFCLNFAHFAKSFSTVTLGLSWIYHAEVCNLEPNESCLKFFFSKFYGKLGIISCLLFHLIWKHYILYWDFDSKSLNCGFFHSFHYWKKTTKQFFSLALFHSIHSWKKTTKQLFSSKFHIQEIKNSAGFHWLLCLSASPDMIEEEHVPALETRYDHPSHLDNIDDHINRSASSVIFDSEWIILLSPGGTRG